MTAYQDILRIVPTIHAAGLVKSMTKKKKKPYHSAVDAIVGTTLIKTESDFIAGV